ncbi:MAG: hypothetical protein QOF14_5303 [Hyphomicrobiales bacterium]|nr:hypothetical protein [Hyphomicrobiales bacterium]
MREKDVASFTPTICKIEFMPGLVRPKFVALDSSHLGLVAADKEAKDKNRQRRAKTFEKNFEESGSVLLLCFHHVQELLSHQNDDVVARRVAFLQSLPMVAALASFRHDDTIGAVTDLQCFEAAIAFRNPAADALAVRYEAAKKMFRLGSGVDLVRPFLENWTVLRAEFARLAARSREVVAISRSGFAGNSDAKIVDLLKGKLRTPGDIHQQFENLHSRLSVDIQKRGDRRIPNPTFSSKSFLEEVKAFGMGAISTGNPGLQILQACGVDLSEIGPDTTVGDVGALAMFRRKLEILNQYLGLPWLELKAAVQENRLPSSIVSNAIALFHPDTQEWDGSELTDRYLACLAAYADVTYVDKRTHEASRQARQKLESFASLVRRVEKAGSYEEIGKQVLTC